MLLLRLLLTSLLLPSTGLWYNSVLSKSFDGCVWSQFILHPYIGNRLIYFRMGSDVKYHNYLEDCGRLLRLHHRDSALQAAVMDTDVSQLLSSHSKCLPGRSKIKGEGSTALAYSVSQCAATGLEHNSCLSLPVLTYS